MVSQQHICIVQNVSSVSCQIQSQQWFKWMKLWSHLHIRTQKNRNTSQGSTVFHDVYVTNELRMATIQHWEYFHLLTNATFMVEWKTLKNDPDSSKELSNGLSYKQKTYLPTGCYTIHNIHIRIIFPVPRSHDFTVRCWERIQKY
jgi:hypothetical protein